MTRIGRDAWLGNGSIVMADVGNHAVVGAGAVVVKPVAAWSIVAGNPAREIRSRCRCDEPSPADLDAI